MYKEVQKKYKNITQEHISLYLSICTSCLKKLSVPKKGLVVKPRVFRDINSRGQVDLIDMQSKADGEFKCILVYQDHLTKFVQLHATKSKRAAEVACHLLDIFCIFGAPAILQSDNVFEFTNSIITELAAMWNGLKIVHGKPCHSDSPGSVERANHDIEDILFSWMEENCNSKWSEGLRFGQVRKNSTLYHGLKSSPYEVMFGQCIKIGFKTSNIPTEILPGLISEEDLDAAMSNQQQHDNSFEILEHQGEEQTEIQTMREEIAAVAVSRQTDDEDIADVEEECEFAQRDVVDAEVMQDEFERGIGMEEENEDNENPPLSPLLLRQIRITRKGIFARENLKLQAKKMTKLSDKKYPSAEVGDSVKVRVPDVDRIRCDARNILGVITAIDENGSYKIGTKFGAIDTSYSPNQFSICNEPVISVEDVPDEEISLRGCARKSSLTGGQGYQRCGCKSGCARNICSCRRQSKLCTSKCHSSLTCSNK